VTARAAVSGVGIPVLQAISDISSARYVIKTGCDGPVNSSRARSLAEPYHATGTCAQIDICLLRSWIRGQIKGIGDVTKKPAAVPYRQRIQRCFALSYSKNRQTAPACEDCCHSEYSAWQESSLAKQGIIRNDKVRTELLD